MTNEELNKWAHELLGKCWHEGDELIRLPDRLVHAWALSCVKCECYGLIGYEEWKRPDYCADLNLAAEVEAKVAEGQRYRYKLSEQVLGRQLLYEMDWNIVIKATAEQRIRAAHATLEGE